MYDVMHFEALGPEAEYLEAETLRALTDGELPATYRHCVTGQTLQSYLGSNPGTLLPPLVTIKTHSVLPENYLSGSRKSVITRSAGYDHIEHLQQKMNIASLREYCVNAVAQTAMKFVYATTGQLNHYTAATVRFDRKSCPAFWELSTKRVLTVFGLGKIGLRIYELAEANGLRVQAVDVRAKAIQSGIRRKLVWVDKAQAMATSDIVVNAMNLSKDEASPLCNVGYFSREYVSEGKDGLIFINVTRGEIAPEKVLLELYQRGKLGGIGLDVFSREGEFADYLQGSTTADLDLVAGKRLVDLALQRSANIYVQPHQGFNSDIAAETKAVEAIRHVVAWYRNNGERFDEQLPYY